MKTQSRIYLNKELQNDDVFVKSELKPLEEITGMPCRKGYDKALISGGSIVNIVSNSYGHLPNEKFFAEVEVKLINAGIQYETRSINRDNRSFAVDYILKDESYHINVKNGHDTLTPMLRFVNSYDGSCKTTGAFGFYRQICANGLHVSEQKIGFAVKHRGDIVEVVLPEIGALVNQFMSNEFYELRKKFEVLAERPIKDLKGFVKLTTEKLDLFKYEASEKNPEPSLNARLVLDVINNESEAIGVKPNLWLGYNAFNQVIHDKLKKTFEAQKNLDSRIFNAVLQAAN